MKKYSGVEEYGSEEQKERQQGKSMNGSKEAK